MFSQHAATEPVVETPPAALAAEEGGQAPSAGIALCLSGGGFRAMLFHVGAIVRLNEFGVLSRLSRVSSVSGGSITAGVLALNWPKLQWNGAGSQVLSASLRDQLIDPLRNLARQNIDVSAIGWGAVNPFKSISEEVIEAYDAHLFHGATLQDLSDESEQSSPKVPRFVFTATNVKTGSLWRFAKPYMADWRVGIVDKPDVPLAVAVAASSAFPPVLSPLQMNLDRFNFRPDVPTGDVPRSLRAEAVLTDGGVYDNLGLEPAWKRYQTILVSDGGKPNMDDLQPATHWPGHSLRLINLLQREISVLRMRQIMAAFTGKDDPHGGTYWGIGVDAAKYPAAKELNCPAAKTWPIAAIDTRLAKLSDADQERLMNWGYAVCDLAVRSYVEEFKGAVAASQFPFPGTGLDI